MVEGVYSHLGGPARHRSAVVEYRAEQHASILGDRLTALAVLRGGKTVARTVPGSTEATEAKLGKAGQAVAGRRVEVPQGD